MKYEKKQSKKHSQQQQHSTSKSENNNSNSSRVIAVVDQMLLQLPPQSQPNPSFQPSDGDGSRVKIPLEQMNIDDPTCIQKRGASGVESGSSLRETLMTNGYLGSEVKIGDRENVHIV